MKILCLYHNDCALELFEWLRGKGNKIVIRNDELDAGWCTGQGFDLGVSYTYRYILHDDVIGAFGGNIVNLHNSYLPWNRGADPNIWSMIENTPRGVTLHYISSKLDQGEIIVQKLLPKATGGTLASTYEELDREAKALFKDAFQYYSFWEEMRKRPLGAGTYHRKAELELFHNSIASYDFPVERIAGRGIG